MLNPIWPLIAALVVATAVPRDADPPPSAGVLLRPGKYFLARPGQALVVHVLDERRVPVAVLPLIEDGLGDFPFREVAGTRLPARAELERAPFEFPFPIRVVGAGTWFLRVP